jgi:polygalacturonase
MGGFVFVRCRDVSLDSIEVKSTPGHAFLVSGGERFHLKNVNVRPPEGDPRRVISSTADHFHVARSHGWIKLEGCEFAGGGDDCVNVRDGTAYASGLTDAHTVRTVRGKSDRLFAPGDRVELLRSDYVPTGFTAPVREVRVIDAAKQTYDVVFAEKVPSSSGDGYVLINREYGSSNVILRDCYFHDNRARGVVLQASDATIERCRFVRNESCAMKITTGWTLKLWCEGYGATNIVVRDCTFDRANGANRDSQDIYFGTYRKEPSAARRDACETPVFRDILFENNRFVDSFGLTAFVGSCGNIVFRGNSFANPSAAKVARPERGAFRICASKDVVFESNVWEPSAHAPKAGMLLE